MPIHRSAAAQHSEDILPALMASFSDPEQFRKDGILPTDHRNGQSRKQFYMGLTSQFSRNILADVKVDFDK